MTGYTDIIREVVVNYCWGGGGHANQSPTLIQLGWEILLFFHGNYGNNYIIIGKHPLILNGCFLLQYKL
jgi:hypothetical protein